MTNAAPDTLRLLAHADLLLLLARWLQVPPAGDPEHSAEDLRELAIHCALEPDDVERLAGLGVERNRISVAEWIAEHNRLFEGGVSCPPNETAFIRRDKGSILADINGFYHAFGFNPSGETGEKSDHVVIELQFVALLLVMAAEAAARGNTEHESVTRAALRSFTQDHIGLWVDIFSNRLEEVTHLPAFEGVGVLLDSVWRRICDSNGIPIPDHELPVDDSPNEGTPYECDGCTAP